MGDNLPEQGTLNLLEFAERNKKVKKIMEKLVSS
jgi:hypothetical protein